MLDEALKSQLPTYLERLRAPVELRAHLDESPASRRLRELLEELSAASGLLTLTVASTSDPRRPSFDIARSGEAPRIRFAGAPLGHEFSSLILALLHSSGHPPKVPEEQLSRVRRLSGNLQFESYYSQSCHNCPDIVQALNLMAALNPNIRHEAIDGGQFAEEVEARGIMAVPTVYLNGELFASGRMQLSEILDRLDKAGAKARAQALGQRDPYDLLIIGGGPAGSAAAIYAARKGIRTGIVAERFGGQVLDTAAIENFVSVTQTQGPQFAAALEAHVGDYEVDLIKHQRAQKLSPGEAISIQLESGATLQAKTIVLATGARWRNLGVPGESEYRNKGVTYCPHCDGPLFKGKRVAVVGGGNSGVEAAIDLAGVVEHVTVLEFAEQLRADEVLLNKLRSLPNVDIVGQAQTTQIVGNGDQVTGLRYTQRDTQTQHELTVQGVFVQIGLIPNTHWLQGSVALSPHGEIEVDARGATSIPGVFAAGDVTTVPFKQIIIAAGDGAKAALGAFDYLIRHNAPAA